MPTYKLPSSFYPSPVADLKVPYVEAAIEWRLAREAPAKMWTTIINAIKEVLYVRGMDHQIVEALLREWSREAAVRADKIKEERAKKEQSA